MTSIKKNIYFVRKCGATLLKTESEFPSMNSKADKLSPRPALAAERSSETFEKLSNLANRTLVNFGFTANAMLTFVITYRQTDKRTERFF